MRVGEGGGEEKEQENREKKIKKQRTGFKVT